MQSKAKEFNAHEEEMRRGFEKRKEEERKWVPKTFLDSALHQYTIDNFQ